MTTKRRDLLVGSAGIAASVAAVGHSAEAKAQTTQFDIHWHLEVRHPAGLEPERSRKCGARPS
jgi:hypothetical protein